MDSHENQTNCDCSSAFRNIETMVVDITDRALINGQNQRKQAMAASFYETQRIKDHFNYSFCQQKQSDNFEIHFKDFIINDNKNSDNLIPTQDQRQLNYYDGVETPQSSIKSSEQFSEVDQTEKARENQKDNPFYGMQRISQGSISTKQNNLKEHTEENYRTYNVISNRETSKNYLNIFYFIIKFKFLLNKFISIRNIFTLKEYHFGLINDKSFGVKLHKINKNIKIRDKVISSIKNNWKKFTLIPVIDPSHFIVVAQEIQSFILILSQFFFLPIKICFTVDINNQYIILFFEQIPLFYFFFEILFKMNKGYYKEGIAVVDRISAYKNYFQNYLIFDIITASALYVNHNHSNYTLIFLIRIFQMQQIFEKIDEHFMLSQKFPISFQLFQLLYQILLVAHICGCGFHYVGLNSDEENNWIVKNGLKDASFFENYVISIYFAIISMITVGFGDITPINTYERIYVIFQTCFSCGIFAFAINTIGSIVKDKQTQIQELKANKNLILTYMKDRNISKQNQNKVIRFLEYSHRNQNDNPQKGKQLIQNMGKSVRDEIYFEFFTKVISQIPLFTNYFTDKVKQEVSSQFSEAVYGTGDCIIQQGKPSKNLYFVVTGEIYQVIKLRESSYNSQQQQITIQVLKQGDTFDDESFLSNLPCKYEYISKNTSQVAYLQKDVFVDILQNYRQDYEQYCTLVHNIRLKNEHNILKECKSCNNKFHSIINCPLLHYEVNRELLLKRYICDQPQKRQDFCRKMKRSNFGNVKYMRNQLRFFRLRLPKNFVYDSQIFDEGHLDIQQNNEFYQLLEYEDDEIFISCSPQLIFSKSQNEIVWLLDEDDTDMQYMGDDIDQSQLNEGTYNSFQLYAQKRRNALFVSKKTLQDDSLKQKKDQEPKFNRSKTSKKQQNQKKQQKTFNSAFSSDFKNYNEFDKYDDSFKKNKRNINLFKQSFVQLKSKSLTSLCNDYCDQISEGTHIIANEDQHISNSEPLDDKIYSKTEIQRNRKSFKDLKKLSIKTQTQTMNIDDSQRLHQQNIQQILPINNAISEFQIPSNQLIQDAVVGGIVDSEKIVSYQTIQNQQYSMCLSPLLEEQPIRNKAQSSISQLPKVKINQKNSQQTLIKNGTNQQMQINQQNQQGLINTSNLLNIKNPQLSPKRNSINFVSGQQNAIGSMINSLGSSLIQKNQSKLSFQNELNPYQPSSNTSNSQLRELSSYSKRSSNQNKQNNQYQQQQSLTGIQQHQQHSIQSFIGNQSHNQLQSFNMILSRQLSNFSSSNKTKKTKGLQTKLNSIVSQNKNEDEQNLAGVEEEEEEDQNKQLTHQQSNFEDQIYTEAFETLFVIPQFESMKLFQNFLPHNNYDLVLENYKTIQHLKNIAQKKSLKTSRKPRKKFGSQNLVKKGRPRNKRKLDLELSPQQLQHSLEEQFLSSQKGNNAINMLLESCKLADK